MLGAGGGKSNPGLGPDPGPLGNKFPSPAAPGGNKLPPLLLLLLLIFFSAWVFYIP